MTQKRIAAILPRVLLLLGLGLGEWNAISSISAKKELGVTDRYQVLVIDGLEDTGEVLKAILEPRGLLVEQVRSDDLLHRTPSCQTPHLIVFHAEDSKAMKTLGRWEDIPQIVIGSIPGDQSKETAGSKTSGNRCYLSKPFEFRDLLSAIEDRLQHCEKTAKAA